MRVIQHYVIRIYRRDGEAVAGLIENVQTGKSAPFQSLADLCELLIGRKPINRRVERNAAPACDDGTNPA